MGDADLAIELDGREPTVAAVVGELDYATSPRLLAAVEPVVAAGGDAVVDLAGVTFCDSSGLNVLVRLHKAAAAAGGSLRLAHVPARIAEIMTIVSLDRLFAVSEPEAGR